MGNQRTLQTRTNTVDSSRGLVVAPKCPPIRQAQLHPLLKLQRQIGNRAVTQQIQAQNQMQNQAQIQTKMSVGKPNDVYEQEADRVADTVMRMPDPPLQRQEEKKDEAAQMKPVAGLVSPWVQRAEEKDETAQTKLLIGPITPIVQRQEEKKDETAQMLQRQEEKKDETAQMLQRQEEKKDETAQMLQRQEEKKDETAQMLQRQEEKKDETAQMLQRQEEKKDETAQMLQRQEEKKDEQAQAKEIAATTPEVTPHLESRIQAMRGGGKPLPEETRTFFESRLGYDLGGVRVHTDSQAAESANHLNAQAFTIGGDVFFGSGKYEPQTSQGKWLLAHELTHTVQQQQPQALSAKESAQPSSIQASPTQANLTQANLTQANLTPERATIQSVPAQLQGSWVPGVDEALDWVADRAANVPGFTLLCYVLGRNPINDRPVDRSAINLIRGVIGLVPGGELIFQALQSSGALERVGNWVSQQLSELNLTWDGIKALFRRAWDEIHLVDGFQAAFNTVRRVFSPTLERIGRFASTVGDRIIQFIKDAILQPVGRFAQQIPGFPLLTVIIGRNPVTGEPVERNATNVIRGILTLIPGGEQVFQNLQQSGVLDQAFAWFSEQLTRLNLTWNRIRDIFSRAWDSLSLRDILSPVAAFERIRNLFGSLVRDVGSFASAAIRKVAEFIFEGVLSLAGGLGQRVLGIVRRAGGVIRTIIDNPIGFIGNLVNAIKRGFQQFSSNILTHLQTGLVSWLFGALAGAGLQLPERFDLRGIVSLVTQILGLTYQRLRGILVRVLGSEERVQRAEQIFDFLVTLVRDGIAAAWERIVEFAGNLEEMLLGGIRDWVARTVVGQAIARLVTLFNPAGAIIQAIMAIYNTVVFFIERAQQIAALADAVFNSISNIASGAIATAADYVERTMAHAIPVMLGFLARFIGLGNISEQIQNVVRQIQAPIENAINRVANWIVDRVRGLLGRGRTQETQQRTDSPNHEALAREAITELQQPTNDSLQDPATLRREKESRARELEQTYTRRLQPGIALRIYFDNSQDRENQGELNFRVVIAPNTITVPGTIRGTSLTVFWPTQLGSLQWHESKGGHAMARHVNITDYDLERRAIGDWDERTKWNSHNTAADIIVSVCGSNRTGIGRWFATASANSKYDQLVFRGSPSRKIGYGFVPYEGAFHRLDAWNAQIVIKKNASNEWFILTAYPIFD